MFLIGGGRSEAAVKAAHAPFLRACGDDVLVVALDDPDRWTASLPGPRVRVTDRPVPADLDGMSGVYVAGGLTPEYWSRVCETDFADALRAFAGVYAGFSAGAMIAASSALVGGWRVDGVPVCDAECGEDLDEVEFRPGLGLVGFAVDVHASQWGTLGRLVRAVDAGRVTAGIAIDEGTCAEVRDGDVVVHGLGAVFTVWPGSCHVLRPAD